MNTLSQLTTKNRQTDVDTLAALTPFASQDIAKSSAFSSGHMFVESIPLESQEPLSKG